MNNEPNFNGVTGNIYSVNNQKHLEQHKEDFSLSSAAWAGFQQWKEKGRQVKKGAKACKIYMVCDKKMTNAKGETYKNAQGDDSKQTVVKGRSVFNFDHTEPMKK